MSPKDLIDVEAAHFMSQDKDEIILGYNSFGKLIPEYLDKFADLMNASIEATTHFIEAIRGRDLLQQTGTVRIYIQIVLEEIQGLKNKINQLLERPTDGIKVDLKPLHDAYTALDGFKRHLETTYSSVVLRLTGAHTSTVPPDEPPTTAPQMLKSPSTPTLHIVASDAQSNLTNIFHEFIAELDNFKMKEALQDVEERSRIFHGIFTHSDTHHTRPEKIQAATRLKEALQKLSQSQEVTWIDQAIYRTNPHLKEIIDKYLTKLNVKDLTSLFQSKTSTQFMAYV